MNGRWTVSEEEKLTTQDALATAEMAASDWTPYNLATFMGTMRTGSQHKLQVNTAEGAKLCAENRSSVALGCLFAFTAMLCAHANFERGKPGPER